MWQALVLVLVFTSGIAAGWQVKTWKTGSETLISERTANEIDAKIARRFEDVLVRIDKNYRVIEHEKQTIIERPVYNVACIDADGMRIINQSKQLAGKPIDTMPRTP